MSTVELTDEQKAYLIRSTEAKITSLENELRSAMSLLNQLRGVSDQVRVENIGRVNHVPDESPDDQQVEVPIKSKYPKLNWKLIVLTSLKEENAPLTTEELYDSLCQSRSEVKSYKRKSIIAKLSNALSSLTREKRVNKQHNPLSKGNFWGLDSWFVGSSLNQQYKEKLLNKYKLSEKELFGSENYEY